MDPFLATSPLIDADHPDVRALATSLRGPDEATTARACFEWVRDRVRHTGDLRGGVITCRASDVLREGTGFCFAKAHLLVALLRAEGIPAGLAYQRLRFDETRFALHGLVAVRLADAWYRVDPRGDRPGITTAFTPPLERLAFTLDAPGERDLPGVRAAPLPAVVEVLTTAATWDEVLARLPDAPAEAATSAAEPG